MRDELTETELWLIDHGLPSFTRRRVPSSSRRVGTVLAAIAAFEVAAVAPSQQWPWWLDLLMCIVAPVVGATAVAVAFDARTRRPATSPSRLAGDAAFVVVPAVIAGVLAAPAVAALTAAANLTVLTVLALDQRFGVFAVVRWCIRHGFGQIRAAVTRLSRSLPLLAVVVLALFYTSEVWAAAAGLRVANLAAVVALLAAAGVLFAVSQIRSGLVGNAANAANATLPEGNPACTLPPNPHAPALSRVEQGNVTVLLVVSQLCVVTATAAAFATLIVTLGSVAVPFDVLADWIGRPPTRLLDLDLVVEIHVTTELLALGAIMAGIAGLVFAVSLAGDQDFQDASRTRLADELATALAVRARYLGRLSAPAECAPTPPTAAAPSGADPR